MCVGGAKASRGPSAPHLSHTNRPPPPPPPTGRPERDPPPPPRRCSLRSRLGPARLTSPVCRQRWASSLQALLKVASQPGKEQMKGRGGERAPAARAPAAAPSTGRGRAPRRPLPGHAAGHVTTPPPPTPHPLPSAPSGDCPLPPPVLAPGARRRAGRMRSPAGV